MGAARFWGPAIAAVGIAAVLIGVASHKRPRGGPAQREDDDASAWRYDTRTFRLPLDRYDLRIEDMGMTSDLGAVLQRTGAEVAINAGFFDKSEKALGLVVSGGKPLAPLAKSLSGGVLTVDGSRARLHETESFVMPEGTTFAVQCRPRLVVNGQPNIKSDDGKRSERTALCLRDGGRTIEVVVARGRADEPFGPSLFRFARWLAAQGCEDALNLDGGPSTGAAWREDGGVATSPPRGPLRQAIVAVKKGPSHTPIDGRAFPPGVLALTWDDGPDAHTLELARYLHDRKVAGTFFVVSDWKEGVSSDPGEGTGVFASGHATIPILGELVKLGHRLGNHTMHHVLLGGADEATVRRELGDNERALDPFLTNELRIFRAPGGDWSEKAARAIEDDPSIGPFRWDIDRKDWSTSLDCRGAGPSCVAGLAERYVTSAVSNGGGIVLLHDRVGHVGSTFALDLAKRLVPALEERGFVFAAPLLRFGKLEARSAETFGDDLAIEDGEVCDASGCAPVEMRPSAGDPLPRVALGAKRPSTRVRHTSRHEADLNGDGRIDACRESDDHIDCALATTKGRAPESTWYAGAIHGRWTLGDLNGDGRADLCVSAGGRISCGLAP